MQYLDDDNVTNILIHSPYKDVPVNGTYRLYEGAIHLQGPEDDVTGPGTLEVALYGHPVVRFALSNTPAVRVGGGEQKLNIPAFSCPLPSPAFTLQETTIFAQDSQKRSGILLREGLVIRQLKEDGAQEPVGRMHFHLINFKHYRGEQLAQSHGDTVREWGDALYSLLENRSTVHQRIRFHARRVNVPNRQQTL
jgi:hypothetical protein